MSKGLIISLISGLVICIVAGSIFFHGNVTSGNPQRKAEHEAHHGGCLNAIGSCETGHVEVTVDGDTLTCWFVGGENNTDKSVRVPDKEITLAIKNSNQTTTLTLAPSPIELAGETSGDCSRFIGRADWLKTTKEFEGSCKVDFKGQLMDVLIRYPQGYDPDHEKHQ
jgi:hypothetical protein